MTRDQPADRRPHVVVVGGGHAGLHAARTARDEDVRVTVVDPTGRHDLAPRLAAVAAGRRRVGDAWGCIADLVEVAVVRQRAVGVDAASATVRLESGEEVAGDAVVVAAGAAAWLPPVDGLDRSGARTLRTADDALRLRALLPRADRLVVVGGGATGVQLAAETADRHALPVHLIEVDDRLLPAHPASLGRRAQRLLRRRGVDVRLATAVSRADARGVDLDDGGRLDGCVVWTTGVASDASTLLPSAPTTGGRLVVDSSLRVAPRVFAAGDVAAVTDVFGTTTAPSAQVALQSGRGAGRNAARVATGSQPRPVPVVDLGWVVDMGGGRGVARVGPVRLAAPVVDRVVPLLHEAVDVRHLLQAGGLGAVLRHAPGRHRPDEAAVRRAERPGLRAIG